MGEVLTNSQIGGRRNMVINGGCQIDQRNSGSEVIPANNDYFIDRFRYNASQASKLKVQQNAQVISPPEGFSHYLGVTVHSNHTVASSDFFFLTYFVEGFDSAHLNFGKSTAKTITISFYVQSSVTGTFSGSLLNASENRAYPYTYTISSANTWERKTITIAGDTTGTWVGGTNGRGLMITFSLGMGSNFTGTAGQWNASDDYGATGENVKFVENASAQWKITGVQLEVGSQATPFEHRSFGEELQLCKRYAYKPVAGQAYAHFGGGLAVSATLSYVNIPLPVEMRINPALTANGTFRNYAHNGGKAITTNPTVLNAGSTTMFIAQSTSSGGGMTAGDFVFLGANNDADAFLLFDAEL
tara:strand:+ start:1 stop:1074 length:1074 start_codon:yes stop_codon:yes gene_type:complete